MEAYGKLAISEVTGEWKLAKDAALDNHVADVMLAIIKDCEENSNAVFL